MMQLDPLDFASLYGNETAKRALEIAAVANHSLQFAGRCHEVDTLIAAGRRIGAGQCYHASSAAPTPLDLNVEVSEPRDCDRFEQEDTTAKIRARVQTARQLREAINPASLDEPAKKLLTDASVMWSLERDAVKRILSVARSIAALAGAERIGRIHVAEALSYARPIEPPAAPEPEPDPETVKGTVEWCQARRVEGKEIVEVDPARVASRFEEGSKEGDICASYSADTLAGCNSKGSTVRKPFAFRGGEWVQTSGWGYRGQRTFECYRVVPLEAFDGPSQPYAEHWSDAQRAHELGGYHGMRASHGSREIVLQGPPVIFIAGQAEQAALI